MKQYERAEGAIAVEALLRRIADGIAKAEVEVAGMTIKYRPAMEASVEVEGDFEGSLASVGVRLTRFAGLGRPIALEQELAHPGD